MTERTIKFVLFVLCAAIVAEIGLLSYQVISKKTSDTRPSVYSGSTIDNSNTATNSSTGQGEVRSLVVLKSSIRLDTAAAVVGATGAKVIYRLPYSHIIVASLTQEQRAALLARPDIAWIEEDVELTRLNFELKDDIRSFFVTYAYAQSTKPPIKVFIIDTGASPTIKYDFKASALSGVDPNDTHGHGGKVAASFLEESKKYGTSISLNSIRDTTEEGRSPVSLTVEAISQALAQGAKVINLSSGLFGGSAPPAQAWTEVVDKVQAAGAVLVVSAGNESDKEMNRFIQHPAVISVGALDNKGSVAEYSNGVRDRTQADIFINGYAPDGSEGTSFSGPRGAAMIADIMSRDGEWNAEKVKVQLRQDIADGKYDASFGERGGQSPAPTIQKDIQAANNGERPAQPPPLVASAEPVPQNPYKAPLPVAGPPSFIPPASPQPTQPTQTPPANPQPSAPVSTPVGQQPTPTPTTPTPTTPTPQPTPIFSSPTQPPATQVPSLPINTQQPLSSGLVPCGITQGGNYSDPNFYMQATSCNFCYLANLIQRIVNFLIMVSIPISVALFAWAGVMFFTSAGNPKNIARAKKIFTSVFWGFLLTLAAWLIVQLALQTITSSNYTPSSFFKLSSCNSYNFDRPRNVSIGNVLSGISVAPAPRSGIELGPDGQPVNVDNAAVQRAANSVELQAACVNSGMTDCSLLKAVCVAESSCTNYQGCNSAGACGPMQIKPATACAADSSIPGCSTQDGPRVAAELNKMSVAAETAAKILNNASGPCNGDLTCMMASYNGGQGATQASACCSTGAAWQCQWDCNSKTPRSVQCDSSPRPSSCVPNNGFTETRNYVQKIQAVQNIFRPSGQTSGGGGAF